MSNKQPSTYTLSPRRKQNHARMVQTILETAREIMRENGAAALSMQELARRLDMRAPSLYHYFSSKMELYDALFRLGYSLFNEHLEKTVQGDQRQQELPRRQELPWQEELRRIFEAYMTFAMQNPELYQLCFERPVPGFTPSEDSAKISFGMLEKYYHRTEQLQAAFDSNLSAQQTADLFIAVMHGLTALHLANEPQVPPGEGRFGSLIPAALSVLEKAWSKQSSFREGEI